MIMKTLSFILGLMALCWLAISKAGAAESSRLDPEGYIRDWIMLAPIALPETGSAADLILTEQIKGEAAFKPKDGDTIAVNGKPLSWKNVTADQPLRLQRRAEDSERPLRRLHGHLPGM